MSFAVGRRTGTKFQKVRIQVSLFHILHPSLFVFLSQPCNQIHRHRQVLIYSPTVAFVKSIKGWDNARVHGVPRLVTYDFLEDLLEDKRAMRHFWAYHPGKPRDIEAMLAGRRRLSKEPRVANVVAGDVAGSPDGVNNPQETARGPDVKKTRPISASKENPSAVGKTTESEALAGSSSTPAKRGNDRKLLGTDPIIDSVAKAGPQNNTNARSVQMQKQVQKLASLDEESIPEVDNRSWELKTKARIFQDKSQFAYHVELTRKKDNFKWFLEILESMATSAPKSYKFRAIQYGSKNEIVLPDIDRDPVPTFVAALKPFTDTFRVRTGYSWDERLLRASMEQPIWQYHAPAPGKPTGSVPPRYTPGHPECVKDLSPVSVGQGAKRDMKPRFARSVRETPQQRLKTDKTTHWKDLTEGRCRKQMKRKAPEALKAERPSQPQKRRKMCESPNASRRARATEAGPPASSLKAGGSIRKS